MSYDTYSMSEETPSEYAARCAHDLNQSQLGVTGYTNWSGDDSDEEMSEEEFLEMFPSGCIWG